MPQKYDLEQAVPDALSALDNIQSSVGAPEESKLAGLKEVIIGLYDKIEGLRNEGYTWEQVCEALKTANIDIAPTTLESYMREVWPEVRKARRLAKAAAKQNGNNSSGAKPISCAKSKSAEAVTGELVE